MDPHAKEDGTRDYRGGRVDRAVDRSAPSDPDVRISRGLFTRCVRFARRVTADTEERVVNSFQSPSVQWVDALVAEGADGGGYVYSRRRHHRTVGDVGGVEVRYLSRMDRIVAAHQQGWGVQRS